MAKFVEVTALLDFTGANDPVSTRQVLVNVDAVDLVEDHPLPGMYCLVLRDRGRVLRCKGTVEDFRALAAGAEGK
jgi:hypothetical protein